jgi:predicted nucleotidyltransferase
VTSAGFDPVLALQTLDRHGVRFVVIGGIGARLHGSPTVTRDTDICYERSPENLERLAAALEELGATLRGVDEDVPFLLDAKTLAAGDHFTFRTRAGDFDLLGTPSGVAGFDELAGRANPFDIDGITVLVASIDDLIRMKRAAGRPKDLIEVEVLSAVRDEIERGDQR